MVARIWKDVASVAQHKGQMMLDQNPKRLPKRKNTLEMMHDEHKRRKREASTIEPINEPDFRLRQLSHARCVFVRFFASAADGVLATWAGARPASLPEPPASPSDGSPFMTCVPSNDLRFRLPVAVCGMEAGDVAVVGEP